MPALLRLCALLCLALACGTAPAEGVRVGRPHVFSLDLPEGAVHQRVRLLGAVALEHTPVDARTARDLSGLAWDADEGRLYAVSNQGYLVHLRPVIEGDRLVDVELLAAHPWMDASGRALERKQADTEALALLNGANGTAGDGELLVSFEGRPRVARFRPDGRWLGEVALPAELADAKAYAGANLGLEALALHPVAGVLVAPERPLRAAEPDRLAVYGLDGRHWRWAPEDSAHGAVTDLAVAPDGSLVVLERSFQNVLLPLVISLGRLEFGGGEPAGAELTVTPLARFSSAEGWAVDNFEGLAHHTGNRWFLVSDDNNSAMQKTLLLYLEVLE